MMTAQEIKAQIEKTAAEMGMDNREIVSEFDYDLIRAEKSGEGWKADCPEKEREIARGKETKSEIISLFKNDLGIEADDNEIWEAARMYVKQYSTSGNKIK